MFDSGNFGAKISYQDSIVASTLEINQCSKLAENSNK